MKTPGLCYAMLGALFVSAAYAADTPQRVRRPDVVPLAVAAAEVSPVFDQRSDVPPFQDRRVSRALPDARERSMLDVELGTASDGGYEYYQRGTR